MLGSEENNVESMRQGISNNVKRKTIAIERAKRAIENNGFLEDEDKPTWFEFKLNNNCNLNVECVVLLIAVLGLKIQT